MTYCMWQMKKQANEHYCPLILFTCYEGQVGTSAEVDPKLCPKSLLNTNIVKYTLQTHCYTTVIVLSADGKQ